MQCRIFIIFIFIFSSISAFGQEQDTVKLNQATVSAHMVERYADRREYRLTAVERRQYSSALKALDAIPKLIVDDQELESVDGKPVRLIINGVPSTPKDLSLISSDSIRKIIYYTDLPIQYSNLGYGSVVDVILKRENQGGSVSLNTLNAVTVPFGNNAVGMKYNFGNSQIGFSYKFDYRDEDKVDVDENLEYSIGGETYRKFKDGQSGGWKIRDHDAEITFNNAKTNEYLFSAKMMFKSVLSDQSSLMATDSWVGDVNSMLTGSTKDRNRYSRPVADIYFSKNFGKKHGIAANVVGTYYDSKYDYSYFEENDSTRTFDTATNIETDKYSLIADAVYNLKLSRLQISMGARDSYSTSKQRHLTSGNKINSN